MDLLKVTERAETTVVITPFPLPVFEEQYLEGCPGIHSQPGLAPSVSLHHHFLGILPICHQASGLILSYLTTSLRSSIQPQPRS